METLRDNIRVSVKQYLEVNLQHSPTASSNDDSRLDLSIFENCFRSVSGSLGIEHSPVSLGNLTDAFSDFVRSRIEDVWSNVFNFEVEVLRTAGIFNEETRLGLANRIIQTYPVARDLAEEITKNALTYLFDLVEELAQYELELVSLCDNQLSRLSEIDSIQLMENETHRAGRVPVLFGLGGKHIFIYKPRDLKVESELTRLLRVLILGSKNPSLQDWTLPCYVVGRHGGWASFISHKPARSLEDQRKYFYRAGFFLSFSTCLRISDLNKENIIAHGDSPVPIDLETAFTHERISSENEIAPIPEHAWNVLHTGLLPSWGWSGEDRIGVDLSGFGALKEQYCSVNTYQYNRSDLSNTRFKKTGFNVNPGKNVLYYKGNPIGPWLNKEQFLEGFSEGMRLIAQNLDYMISEISNLESAKTRYVVRATAGYQNVLSASYHPRNLLSREARNAYLVECLQRNTKNSQAIIDAELRSCIYGDIPRFESRPVSASIKECFYDLPDNWHEIENHKPGLESVKFFLLNLTQIRVEFEIKLIKGALNSLKSLSEKDETPINLVNLAKTKTSAPDAERVLKTLPHIAAFLERYVSEESKRGFDWLGFKDSGAGHLEYNAIGHDFYCGVSGILFTLTQNPVRTICSGTIDPDRLLLGYSDLLSRELKYGQLKLGGAYSGTASAVAPTLLALKALSGSKFKQLEQAAFGRFESVAASEKLQQHVGGTDLFFGVSGLIASISLIAHITESPDWRFLASKLVHRLLEELRSSKGCPFPHSEAISAKADGGLTGYSHGMIGIAVALGHYLEFVSNDKAVKDAISDLVSYELKLFDLTIFNWPDFRQRSRRQQKGEFTWAHGAPGIYLALQYLESLDIAPCEDFLFQFPANEMVKHHLSTTLTAIKPMSDNLSTGAIGLGVIIARILKGDYPNLLTDVISKSGMSYYLELDSQPFEFSETNMPGVTVGKCGSLLGLLELYGNSSVRAPLLPKDILSLSQSKASNDNGNG